MSPSWKDFSQFFWYEILVFSPLFVMCVAWRKENASRCNLVWCFDACMAVTWWHTSGGYRTTDGFLFYFAFLLPPCGSLKNKIRLPTLAAGNFTYEPSSLTKKSKILENCNELSSVNSLFLVHWETVKFTLPGSHFSPQDQVSLCSFWLTWNSSCRPG